MKTSKKQIKAELWGLLEPLGNVRDLGYLDILPVKDYRGEPIYLRPPLPIVAVPLHCLEAMNAVLKQHGRQFIDSTVMYVPGYHYPDGYCDKAIGYYKGAPV